MTSYPTNKTKFDAWHKAMVAGATVDKPNYSTNRLSRPQRAKRVTRHRRRHKRNAKKD